ncbi:MAG TPA: malate dehydrogenase [Bacteroidales bacterium]|nr:MAG: malate dehydrogenase [Bacteroidetes bacterium GWF2_33_38]OFY75019.1 MAG: malate dehydrogenase [Bacteroidetes bacterium RIFOXYA12_FULL_33_9]OFY88073.1 MAG: malate dehydrogenase [Bacteroidetes bacterium RIFOXYA2_FULL_33_7]HBF87188.1 malate dehydrogenase [Bacteroidales bacterium]
MYEVEKVSKFIISVFEKIGCSSNDANVVAEVLLAAELRGIPSHGLIRIMDYVGMWEKNRINLNPSVKIIHETPSTAVVDGDNCYGMIAGKKSMQIAIEKAKNVGTGWVATNNSNHFGIAGFYSLMATEEDMIGIAMTNANPLIAPTFSTSRLLGTNPIAVAIPTKNQPTFIADFATTPIARGKLALMEKKGEKAPLGFVQDKYGNPSTDPAIITQGGAILPLGGDYEHSSHKGYCMAAIVDIFSAVFSGANFGPFVPPQVPYLPLLDKSVGKGLGHFFGAMRIDAFQKADEFKAKMDEWIETFRNAESIKGMPKVVIPGDPERESEIKVRKEGIKVNDKVLAELKTLSEKYEISMF